MATAEKVDPGSDWHLPLWTADGEVWPIGHIQSAGCLGQKEVVIAAHNACIREAATGS